MFPWLVAHQRIGHYRLGVVAPHPLVLSLSSKVNGFRVVLHITAAASVGTADRDQACEVVFKS